ncbi:Reverse transcriptase (RNA-dependent DNA polymerase) [Nesidiocoris tenuis]|uniref:Reverse transcriptase (RNA-dependent DNA polymerase) n=1 Tax=Nesidiocoris tenuis TaxID=355587 RepID=A0ABN7ABT3_9HEMI|nr:Reverse transcriptase (RNA-dependent DNA polymerase) [Nesidiocoris tenuis]
MPFGLRNAPSTFQRFMNEVLNDLNFVLPYLDDIIVLSESEEEHLKHLKSVFDRLDKHGLRINVGKSEFGHEEIPFFGYLFTCNGSKPLPAKVQAILEYKLPETIAGLRRFLGMLNFYSKYIPEASKTQALLHEFIKDARKKDTRPWID